MNIPMLRQRQMILYVRTVVLAIFLLVIYLPANALTGAFAQDREEDALTGGEIVETADGEQHLIVPVYPRGQKKAPKTTGDISDLHGMFIQLEDGSVLSVAQWILGSLKKDRAGIGMSEEEQQLFLGQVARAYAGFDPVQGTRAPVATPFAAIPKPVPVPKGLVQNAKSVAKYLLNLFGGNIGDETHWALRKKQIYFGPIAEDSGVMQGPFNEALNKNVDFYRTPAKYKYQLHESEKKKQIGVYITNEKSN